jgi:hypothetical protein
MIEIPWYQDICGWWWEQGEVNPRSLIYKVSTDAIRIPQLYGCGMETCRSLAGRVQWQIFWPRILAVITEIALRPCKNL